MKILISIHPTEDCVARGTTFWLSPITCEKRNYEISLKLLTEWTPSVLKWQVRMLPCVQILFHCLSQSMHALKLFQFIKQEGTANSREKESSVDLGDVSFFVCKGKCQRIFDEVFQIFRSFFHACKWLPMLVFCLGYACGIFALLQHEQDSFTVQ